MWLQQLHQQVSFSQWVENTKGAKDFFFKSKFKNICGNHHCQLSQDRAKLWVSFSDLSFGAITKCSSRKDFQPTEHINNSKKEPTVVGYSRKENLLKYCSFFLNEEEIENIISDEAFAWLSTKNRRIDFKNYVFVK